MSESSANIFGDQESRLDLLLNAIHTGSGEYPIPQEAREGEGEFNLESLLNSGAGHGSQDDGLEKVCHVPRGL